MRRTVGSNLAARGAAENAINGCVRCLTEDVQQSNVERRAKWCVGRDRGIRIRGFSDPRRFERFDVCIGIVSAFAPSIEPRSGSDAQQRIPIARYGLLQREVPNFSDFERGRFRYRRRCLWRESGHQPRSSSHDNVIHRVRYSFRGALHFAASEVIPANRMFSNTAGRNATVKSSWTRRVHFSCPKQSDDRLQSFLNRAPVPQYLPEKWTVVSVYWLLSGSTATSTLIKKDSQIPNLRPIPRNRDSSLNL